jgi:uncharacterized protein (DUF1800 family)
MRRPAIIAASVAFIAVSGTAVAQAANTTLAGDNRSNSIAVSADKKMTVDQQVMQVLNRLGFGPRPGDVLKVHRLGVDAWIDQQLHPERLDDSEMDRFLSRYTFLNQGQNDLARDYADFVQARMKRRLARRDTTNTMTAEDRLAFKQMNRERMQLIWQLQSARVARAVASQRQLLEVMTDFWENHFNVYVQKGAPEPYYLVDYDRTIREHALGKFRDLLGAVAHSPAMLFYLDNAQSRVNSGGLNENYGRERLCCINRIWRGWSVQRGRS